MDFPVEFTLHLGVFPDKLEVRELLRSHDFMTSDLGRGCLRVTGSFLQLKAVKVHLEGRVLSQTSSSPVSNTGPAPQHATDAPPSGSVTPAAQTFVVDTDVFRYAQRLRKRDVDVIMKSHEVTAQVREVGGNTYIRLVGRGAELPASHLQNLLSSLSQSLRTQEVPLKDMGPEGIALLRRIQQKELVQGSVLVCEVEEGLHLVGPSAQSYELQQQLLRRTGDQSGRTGRTIHRGPRGGSSSLPPNNRSRRDSGSFTDPPAAGAAASSSSGGAGSSSSGGAGSSSSKPVELRGAAAAPARRSSSEPRQKVKDVQTGRGNRTMTSLRQSLMNFSPTSVRQKLRSLRHKR